MSFAINFWYEPEKNKKDLTEGKAIHRKTFVENKVQHAVISEGNNLILKRQPGTKEETIVFSHPLNMDPNIKHMVVLISNNRILTIHLDGVLIKQINLPKATKPKAPKPKKPKVKKPKPKKSKPKKTKTKPKVKAKTKTTKSKKPKSKKVKSKKKKPKRLKPKKLKSKK